MNVTPSKILLGLSLAAYGYCSWDQVFPSKAEAAKPPAKTNALTAAVVNRSVTLELERDPFNSVPLGQTLESQMALPVEPGKDLGELKLNGVMVTFAERAAVINGKTLHEGQTMETPTGATIRVKKIGVGMCVIEGGGAVLMLRVDEDKKPGDEAGKKSEGGASHSAGGGGSNGATSAAKSPRTPGQK